jgi:2-dehydro-3-deoxyphosphooctonate aldolase (KDO 8-P synthase)
MISYDTLPKLKHAQSNNFLLIAGPCVVEGKDLLEEVAGTLVEISHALEIPLVFKSSFRKANRSRKDSFTGIGDEAALALLQHIGQQYDVPVVTDIHESDEAALAAQYVEMLQIPAFLCRQTELLEAAGNTGRWVNIKKGQFLSPDAMRFAAEKIVQTGNKNVMLTERGTTFGYQDLVVDFRGIPIMRETGFPVIMDCTHSLQQPNQSHGVTGGQPKLIETIARAAIATGADGLFIETHPNPSVALSDGANMIALKQLKPMLERLVEIRKVLNKWN